MKLKFVLGIFKLFDLKVNILTCLQLDLVSNQIILVHEEVQYLNIKSRLILGLYSNIIQHKTCNQHPCYKHHFGSQTYRQQLELVTRKVKIKNKFKIVKYFDYLLGIINLHKGRLGILQITIHAKYIAILNLLLRFSILIIYSRLFYST